MPKFIDLSKKRFGKWVVLRRQPTKMKVTVFLCECDCGTIRPVKSGDLIQGKSLSCGCLHNELIANRNYKHGLSDTRVYRIWANMISRCTNKKTDHYKDYGGRGISVCPEWFNFTQFFHDMGYPPTNKHSIDRINNMGNYVKSNCKWSTQKEQCQNRRKKP